MARQPSHGAFRAQLLQASQRQLFDYWAKRAGARAMPGREDIHPADFPKLLPHISLIDIEPSPRRFRIRLAGTGLREIYDREITGLRLDEFDWAGNQDYWRPTYNVIANTGRPAQGVIRGPRVTKDHLVLFWLRLPLSLLGISPAMILCHDLCIPATDMPESLRTPASGAA